MSDGFRERYNAVLASPRWKSLRQRIFADRKYTCWRCQQTGMPLELHHRTYERLGDEWDSDLEVVCHNCHKIADAERAARGREKSASALYDAQLYGWASKKYGEDVEIDDQIVEEFNEWQERRNY